MSKPNDFLSRFGFHCLPFTREIRVTERFACEVFDPTLEQLLRAVQQRMSAALIAPAGTGKTALLRALLARLPETRYRLHYLKVTDLSKRDLCREIACALDTEPAGTYPALVRRLQERFTQAFDTEGMRPVMLIDEAHDIRPEVLAILRILTNFDMDSRLVVSFILSGQPPLAKLLRHEKLEAVAQRLSHCATLRLLSRKELTDYIDHRCRIAGATSIPFDSQASEALYEIGRGNLRATDHLALKSLHCAHDGDCNLVDTNHVVEARRLLWA
jgi:type II secretory pathway predicted ATPase ExeA